MTDKAIRRGKPEWLRVKIPSGEKYNQLRNLVDKNNLHTICESGNCPNMGECWGNGTATFLILGKICTRSCGFCSVETGKPAPVDLSEPQRIGKSVKLMRVKHCVITSVDRDDLPDGGATVWKDTILEVKRQCPYTTIEALIPDFKGNKNSLAKIVEASPEIVSHNLETVQRLTKTVRIQAKYDRSLDVLNYLKKQKMTTKSGIMLGLGETEKEIIETMDDLKSVGVNIITIGQYLQPSKKHLPVQEFISPLQFEKYRKIAVNKGFQFVESAPLVRSSYHAEKHIT